MPVALPPVMHVQPVTARAPASLAGVMHSPVSADFTRDMLEPRTARPVVVATGVAAPVAVAPVGALTMDEIGRSVESASIGGIVAETRTLDSGSYGSVRALAGTEVAVGIHGSTIEVTASPGFVLDLEWGPNVEIQTIRYDVDRGEFEVDATGPGPDFIYRAIATYVANHNFRDLLPADMQRSDYNPRQDPDVQAGVERMVFSLLTGEPGPGGIRIQNPSARATLRLDREIRVDLPDDMSLIVPRGARFQLNAAFEGPVEAPVMREVSVRSTEGITIRKNTGTFASLIGLEIHSATLRPGGQLSMDYQLLPERALNDGVSLFRLLVAGASVASGDGRGLDALSAPAPNVRLESARRQVEGMIDTQVEPAIARVIREHAGAIAGVDLVRVSGLPAQ